jgi:two-component system, NarL family, nitrate/nitrite response regulator NarL
MDGPSPSITLVVADDHPLYRAGLVEAIRERDDLELLAVCSGGREALEQILALRPQAALLDLRMRDLDGIAVLDELERLRCPTRVVFLSAFEDGHLVHRAVTSGAAGYLSKETDRDEICEAIVTAAAGEIVVSPSLHTGVVRHLRRQAGPQGPGLAPREREVMRLTAQGLSGPEIADRLGIQATTVKTHLKRAYRKLDVSDRASMVAEAMRQGLLS